MSESFASLSQRFLSWAAKCRSASTVNVYRHYFTQFVRHQRDLAASDMTPAILTAWARTWHQAQAIKRLYAWAVKEDCSLVVNPIAAVKHPPRQLRRRIHTAAEFAGLMRESKPDLRRLLLAYRETLARPAELRAAEFTDLVADDPTIDLREALLAGRASIVLYAFKDRTSRRDTDKPRVILLSPRAGRLIVWLMDRRPADSAAIFLTHRGRPWTSNALRCRFRVLRRRLRITRDKRGETIVPYTLRHTGATIAASMGVRDRILADIMGHIDTKTTSRYLHLQTQHLQAAMKEVWKRRAV